MDTIKSFEEVRKKFERGVYKELNLLLPKEKKYSFFEIDSCHLKDLWQECAKLMPSSNKRQFLKYIKNQSTLFEGLDYLHHHFLDGNFIFTYALNLCSRRWTIDYLEEKNISYQIPIEEENIFLAYLFFLTEVNRKEEYQVVTSNFEYYLYVLETKGLIIRRNHGIYLTKKGYQEGKKFSIIRKH